LARQCQLPKPEGFFTVGLFSALDAMMDQPLEELLKELPLAEEPKAALLEHKGVNGEALNSTLAMEINDFSFIGFCGLQVTQLSDIYLDSINWAEEILDSL
jgi:EAL and modified HD-GYP domain-containing signal transduction protein